MKEEDSWSWEKDLGFDDDGYQRMEKCLAIVECPVCGKDVELVADTEAWVQEGDKWVHDGYGPALGECCDKVLADWCEGTFSFDLPKGKS